MLRPGDRTWLVSPDLATQGIHLISESVKMIGLLDLDEPKTFAQPCKTRQNRDEARFWSGLLAKLAVLRGFQ
jgi:hypothetical protein